MKNSQQSNKKPLVTYALEEADASSDMVLGPLLLAYPAIAVPLIVARSFYRYAMVRKYAELEEYVIFIGDNPEEFSDSTVGTKEFQDGLVLHLESYLKLRVEEKRFISRQILLGFAKANKKIDYPLERLQDTLQKMSRASIGFIGFIKGEILPRRKTRITSKVESMDLSSSDKDAEWWFTSYDSAEAISIDIEEWLFDNYSPNSEFVKSRYGDGRPLEGENLSMVSDIEKQERFNIYEPMQELTQLGVMGVSSGPVTYGGGGELQYRFSSFGKKFLEYLENSEFGDLLNGS